MSKLLAKNIKRLAAFICCLVMMASLLPMSAFAANPYTVTVRYSSNTANGMPIVDPDTIKGPSAGDYSLPIGTPFEVGVFPEVEGYKLADFARVGDQWMFAGLNFTPQQLKSWTGTKDIEVEFFFDAVYYTVKILRPDGSPYDKALRPDGSSLYKIKVPVGRSISESSITEIKNNLPASEEYEGLYMDYRLNNNWNINLEVKNNMTLYLNTTQAPVLEVFFDAKEGLPEPKPVIVKLGDTVPEPLAPSKAAFKFIGWREVGQTSIYDFATEVTTEGKLYLEAVWELKTSYTVSISSKTIDSLSGEPDTGPVGSYSQTKLINTPYIPPIPNVDPNQYTLIYAVIKSDAITLTYVPTLPYSIFEGYVETATKHWTDDCFIEFIYSHAEPKVEECIVNFNAKGGIPQPVSQTVTVGELVSEPAPLTRQGYEFKYWQDAAAPGVAFSFSSPIASAGTLNLEAVWEQKTNYTITQKALVLGDGGIPVDMPEILLPIITTPLIGDPCIPVDPPVATWYTLQYIYIHYGSETIFYMPIMGVPLFQAHIRTATNVWTDDCFIEYVYSYSEPQAGSCVVSFDAAGGTPQPASQTVTVGETVTNPGAISRVGYTFDGWFDGDTLWVFTKTIDQPGTLNLVARWTEKTEYTITQKKLVINSSTGALVAVAPDIGIPKRIGDPEIPEPPTGLAAGHTLVYMNILDGAGALVGVYYPIVSPAIFENMLRTATSIWRENCTIEYVYTYVPPLPAETFTVTFDSNGGNAPLQFLYDVEYLALVPLADCPTVMTKGDGTIWTFAGWYHDRACTNDWDHNYDVIQGPTTLYANWERIAYTVHVEYTIDQPFYSGATLTAPKPVEDYQFGLGECFYGLAPDYHELVRGNFGAYVLEGVYLNKSFIRLSQWQYITGAPEFYVEAASSTFTKDLDIEYIFSASDFTVTFDQRGGIIDDIYVGSFERPVAPGEKVIKDFNDPKKLGYKFICWDTEENIRYDFDSPVVKSITLHAVWEIQNFKVSFDLNYNPELPLWRETWVQYNELVPEPPIPSRVGYTLAMWCWDAADRRIGRWDFDNELMRGYDFTLYAHWNINSHQVVFKDEDPNIAPYYDQLVTYGEPIYAQPSWQRKLGYSFAFWADLNGTPWAIAQSDNVTMPDHPVTLVARWNQLNLESVEFSQGTKVGDFDAVVSADAVTDIDVDVADVLFEISNVVPENNLWVDVFIDDIPTSWGNQKIEDPDGDGFYEFVAYQLMAEHLVNGQVITYKVFDYNENGTEKVLIGTFTVTVDITPYIIAINGYYSPDVDGYWHDVSIPGVPEYTEYVIQPPLINATTRKIDGFSFTTSAVADGDIEVKAAVTTPELTRELGTGVWANCYVYSFKHDRVTLTEPLYYYIFDKDVHIATVKVVPQFIVDIDFNFGESWCNYPLYPVYNAPIEEPAPITRTGYTLDGWYIDAACTVGNKWEFYYGVTVNMTLYAKWVPELRYITFDLNGGELNGSTDSFTWSTDYGTTIPNPGTPTKTGYTFAGWYPRLTGGSRRNPDTYIVTNDETWYARWTNVQYTIDFDTNEGTWTDLYLSKTQVKWYGEYLDEPAEPTRVGYTFNGWYYDLNNANSKWEFDVDTVTGNGTLYASWSLVQITITFDLQGGNIDGWTETFTRTTGYDTVIENPGTPTRDGFDFIGWWTLGAVQKYPGVNYVTVDETWYACWKNVDYIIDFDTCDGTWTGSTSLQHQGKWYGELLDEPDEPTRLGYTFNGWYFDLGNPGSKWDFDVTTVTSSGTLYASWSQLVITITFDLRGGNVGGWTDDVIRTAIYDNPVEAPADPVRVGYEFAGWWTTPSSGGVEINPATENVLANATWYARWTNKTYTITFDTNSGTWMGNSSLQVQNKWYDELLVKPTDPVRPGFTFNGWFYDLGNPASEWDFDVNTVTSSGTLYASWVDAFYTVEFISNGSTWLVVPGIPYNHTVSSIAPYSELVPESTAFRKWQWFDSGDWHVWDVTSTPVTQDIKLEAEWDDSCFVAYNYVDVSNVAHIFTSHIVTNGYLAEDIGEPVSVRPGPNYKFKGWFYDDEDLLLNGIEWVFATKQVTRHVSLFAHWDEEYYTVTFNDPVCGTTTPTKWGVQYNTTIDEPTPAPTYTGFQFNGWWYTDDLGVTYKPWDFGVDTVKKDIDLIASWLELFTVTFIGQNGNTSGVITVLEGTLINDASDFHGPPAPTESGYQFDRWLYDELNDGNLVTWDVESRPVRSNMTLISAWKPIVPFIIVSSVNVGVWDPAAEGGDGGIVIVHESEFLPTAPNTYTLKVASDLDYIYFLDRPILELTFESINGPLLTAELYYNDILEVDVTSELYVSYFGTTDIYQIDCLAVVDNELCYDLSDGQLRLELYNAGNPCATIIFTK